MDSHALKDVNAWRGGKEPFDAKRRVVAYAKCIKHF